jgi:hypothetical protein
MGGAFSRDIMLKELFFLNKCLQTSKVWTQNINIGHVINHNSHGPEFTLKVGGSTTLKVGGSTT